MSVVLALAGVAGGGWWWTELRFRESTDNAYLRGELAIVGPRVAGYVVDVAVADNQRVRRSDVLVRLDDADYRARLAEAELAAGRAARVDRHDHRA